MGKKILTLNIGASTVTLAEYAAAGRRVTLEKYGTATLAAPLDVENTETVLTSALWEIVRSTGIRAGKVAVAVSGQMVFPRFAAIPMTKDTARFEQFVWNEIEQNIPFPADEMVCDHQVLGDTESGDKSVMIVAAKVDQIEAITDALQSAGFTPEIVGVAPIATTNVLRAVAADADACAVLLDIGAKTTSLVIAEGEKLYNRSIPVAGNTVTKEIAQALGCTQEEAEAYKRENAYVSMGGVMEDEDETLDRVSKVCRAVMTRLHAEISRSINFYRSQQGGSAPTKLYLTGGTSLLPQLGEFFQDSLGIEVEYLNPFTAIAPGAGVDQSQLEADSVLLSATAGMALQAVKAAAFNINLMPPSILEAKAEVARIPFVAVGALGFVAAAVLWLMMSVKDTETIQAQADDAEERAELVKATTDAVESAKRTFTDVTAKADALKSVLALRDRQLRRMQLVRGVLDENLWIARWNEAVEKVTVIDTPARGRTKERSHEEEKQVTEVTFRCWKDKLADVVAAEKARRAELKAAVAEGGDETETAAEEEAVSNSPLDIVCARLKEACPGIVVEAGGQPQWGPDGCLQEYTVKIQFKEAE